MMRKISTIILLLVLAACSSKPTVEWTDFPYRGFMLDVARDFRTVDEVLEIIDLMASWGKDRHAMKELFINNMLDSCLFGNKRVTSSKKELIIK